MQREDYFSHPGLEFVESNLTGGISRSALRLLNTIIQEFFVEGFTKDDLEEIERRGFKNFDCLYQENLLKKDEDDLFYLNHDHPLVKAQLSNLSEVFQLEKD